MTRAVESRTDIAEVLLRKLHSLAPLSAAEMALVANLSAQRQSFAAGADIIDKDDPVTRPLAILSGWGCRALRLADGRRQIVTFLLPGDGIGICRTRRPRALSACVALTRVVAADAQPLVDFEAAQPDSGLTRALHLAAENEQESIISHVMRLGRLTAYERMGHLLLELYDRLALVGLTTQGRFTFPLTQEVLADALGLSVVHVNRTLQQLRRDRLIEMSRGYVNLPHRDRLADSCGYEAKGE